MKALAQLSRQAKVVYMLDLFRSLAIVKFIDCNVRVSFHHVLTKSEEFRLFYWK